MTEQVQFSSLAEILRLHEIGAMASVPVGWRVIQRHVRVDQLISPLGDTKVDEILGYEPRRAHFDQELGRGRWAVCLIPTKGGGVYQSVVDIIAPKTEQSVRGVRRLANGAILHAVK